MKKIPHILIFTWAFLILAFPMNAQTGEIPEGISLSFKAGNAEELSKFFHSNVELIILEKEDVYSRSQAEQIIRKFFTEHKPVAFKIIFEGGKENSRYAIGSLQTQETKYRVYILMKKQDESPIIHQLRIEKEEDNE
ncbi:DUF4783 domain-containing protein [Bacteroidota bacterium]